MKNVHLALGRVSNLPTVWTNVVAGAVLAGGSTAAGSLLSSMALLSAFYVGGMYLNDAFDAPVDRFERPERPIPAGAISVERVLRIGFSLLGSGIVGLALLGWIGEASWGAPVAGMVLALAIVAYDLRHKGFRYGPLLMALCRALVYVTAGLATGGTIGAWFLVGAGALFAYVAALTQLAKSKAKSPVGIGTLIAGISVLDGLIVLASGHTALAILCVAAALATRRAQSVISGT
jgi:4-hydroxybenzoate polyprenyltransferase